MESFLVWSGLVLVSGVWCLVSGVWCLVSGVWCLVSGVWCLVSGVWCLAISATSTKMDFVIIED
ncbi:MAG: hypothetical protein ACK443_09600 [Methylococcaceae bacterium]|jgi:hypothetical protein